MPAILLLNKSFLQNFTNGLNSNQKLKIRAICSRPNLTCSYQKRLNFPNRPPFFEFCEWFLIKDVYLLCIIYGFCYFTRSLNLNKLNSFFYKTTIQDVRLWENDKLLPIEISAKLASRGLLGNPISDSNQCQMKFQTMTNGEKKTTDSSIFLLLWIFFSEFWDKNLASWQAAMIVIREPPIHQFSRTITTPTMTASLNQVGPA